MQHSRFRLRLAEPADIPSIRAMQERSFRGLGGSFYRPEAIEAFIRRHGTMDDAVVAEGHTFVVLGESGEIVASGGWSRLAPGYGGGGTAAAPGRATVRSVFVEPGQARRGLGSAIMRTVEGDATRAGVTALELMATLSGVPLYAALGYRERGHRAIALGGDLALPVVDMEKMLPARAAAA